MSDMEKEVFKLCKDGLSWPVFSYLNKDQALPYGLLVKVTTEQPQGLSNPIVTERWYVELYNENNSFKDAVAMKDALVALLHDKSGTHFLRCHAIRQECTQDEDGFFAEVTLKFTMKGL